MARFTAPLPNEAAAFEELAVIIEELHRFALVFAICASDSAANNHISRYLSLNPKSRIATVWLNWPDGRIATRLHERYEADKPDAIFIMGLEAWIDRGENAKGNEFTIALNHGRDYLHEYVPCPIIFWCTSTVYNFIRRNAHDFYSVATSTLHFSPSDSGCDVLPPFTRSMQAAQSLSSLERKKRITELQELSDDKSVGKYGAYFYISILQEIATLLNAESQMNEALIFLERARFYADTNNMTLSPQYGSILNDIAVIQELKGDYDSAKKLCIQALSVYDATIGNINDNYATSLFNLGRIEKAEGNYVLAKERYLQALAIEEVVLGHQETSTAMTIDNLAQIEQLTGNYAEAKYLYEQALEILEQTSGRLHPYTAATIHNLARLEQETGNYATARALYEQSLAIEEASFGQLDPRTAKTMYDLATLVCHSGEWQLAYALAAQAANAFEQNLGKQNLNTLNANRLLLAISKAQSRAKDACMEPAPVPKGNPFTEFVA